MGDQRPTREDSDHPQRIEPHTENLAQAQAESDLYYGPAEGLATEEYLSPEARAAVEETRHQFPMLQNEESEPDIF